MQVSLHGQTSRIRTGSLALGGISARAPVLARYRETLAAHLVLSIADLRLRKRVQERARRTPSAI
jgi:hypothetical protein